MAQVNLFFFLLDDPMFVLEPRYSGTPPVPKPLTHWNDEDALFLYKCVFCVESCLVFLWEKCFRWSSCQISGWWLLPERCKIFSPNLDAPLREYVLMKKYIIKRNNLFLSFSEPVTQILFCLFYPQMIERNSYLIMKVFVWSVVPNTLNLKDVNMLYCWAVMFSSWILRQSGMFQHIFTTEWQKNSTLSSAYILIRTVLDSGSIRE